MMIKIRKEQEKRQVEFKNKMGGFVEDEGEREQIVEGYDNRMRNLDHQIKNEAKRQEDSLETKLANRKNKKQQALQEVSKRI